MTRQKEAYLIVQKVTWITDPDMKLQFAHNQPWKIRRQKRIC